LIAAGGSGRSVSVIPAVPAAWSVTTIAFIRRIVGHLPEGRGSALAPHVAGPGVTAAFVLGLLCAASRGRSAVSQGTSGRVALVFQGEPDASLSPRLQPMSNALEAAGLTVTSVPFHHHHAADLRNRLADFGPGDGIVVWADPLGEGGDRRTLDRALRHAESTGAWVSTRPDVIDKLGTKDVLVTTRSLGWGSDTHRYQDRDEFRRGFPARLGADGVRVLKATRGNGGRTVWKVRLPGGPARNALGPHAPVIVQHARIRDRAATTMTLADAMHLIEEAGALDGWGGAGYLVDQEFIPGVTRGIVRCYLVGDAVVGFAR
jgi:hypothetical protein